MFKDLIQRVGLENYVLEGDLLQYSGTDEEFFIRKKSVSFSTHRPLEARHRFYQICERYPKNFFAQSFYYGLRSTAIPKLSALERSEANRIQFFQKNSPALTPELVEMLQAYFSQCPE